MNFEFWFWVVIAFFIGRLSKLKIYIGHNEEEYAKADIGILRK